MDGNWNFDLTELFYPRMSLRSCNVVSLYMYVYFTIPILCIPLFLYSHDPDSLILCSYPVIIHVPQSYILLCSYILLLSIFFNHLYPFVPILLLSIFLNRVYFYNIYLSNYLYFFLELNKLLYKLLKLVKKQLIKKQ